MEHHALCLMVLVYSPMVPTGRYVLDIISFAQKCQIRKEDQINNSDNVKERSGKAKLY